MQKYIRLGDIDGDGRCDYCALNDDGSMRCWRNGGLKDVSDNWQAMGLVFNEKDFGNIDGVRLVDINGDVGWPFRSARLLYMLLPRTLRFSFLTSLSLGPCRLSLG